MSLFKTLSTEQDAIDMIKAGAWVCYAAAGLMSIIGLLVPPIPYVDVVIYLALGVWLQRGKSRLAAVLFALVSIGTFVVTAASKFGYMEGGRNIFLAAILLIVSIRVVEAAFKLPRLADRTKIDVSSGGR